VGGRIVAVRNHIYTGRDEPAVFHDQSAEGAAVFSPDIFKSQINGLPHPVARGIHAVIESQAISTFFL
jgi:hypothetical protein